MIIQFVSICLHLIWLQCLVVRYEMGLEGIALASLITAITSLGLMLIYSIIASDETKKALQQSAEYSSWTGWLEYFRLGVPGVLAYGIDVWIYEVIQICSTSFGPLA